MRIAIKNQPDMQLLPFFKKIRKNPWVGILISLILIVPSLYIILEDVTVLRKEYITLAIGFPIYIKCLKKIFEDILDISDDLME